MKKVQQQKFPLEVVKPELIVELIDEDVAPDVGMITCIRFRININGKEVFTNYEYIYWSHTKLEADLWGRVDHIVANIFSGSSDYIKFEEFLVDWKQQLTNATHSALNEYCMAADRGDKRGWCFYWKMRKEDMAVIDESILTRLDQSLNTH